MQWLQPAQIQTWETADTISLELPESYQNTQWQLESSTKLYIFLQVSL